MMNGFNPACVFIMPMLGRKQNEWPRFRDCFVTEDNNIAIYTRVGGGNRNAGYNEEKLYEDPLFIKTYDDEYDNTYATYEFNVPEKWKADFDLILEGKVTEISEEYKTYLKEFFPTLTENGFFDRIFNPEAK
jgi:hypothetical protein